LREKRLSSKHTWSSLSRVQLNTEQVDS
jgi:hypothetical protein